MPMAPSIIAVSTVAALPATSPSRWLHVFAVFVMALLSAAAWDEGFAWRVVIGVAEVLAGGATWLRCCRGESEPAEAKSPPPSPSGV